MYVFLDSDRSLLNLWESQGGLTHKQIFPFLLDHFSAAFSENLCLTLDFLVCSYKRRDLLNRVYADDEDRQYAIERAEQLQSEIDADFPSFVKPMLQSHVTGGFWLVSEKL